MKRGKTTGFSLLEIIAAIVILSVVAAATIATVAPLRAKSDEKLAAQEIASLNALTQRYFLQQGHYPPDVRTLLDAGYLADSTSSGKDRLQRIEHNYTYSPQSGLFTVQR